MAKKYVYAFGAGQAEGRADMKNLLGGKGANLAEMSNSGIPVPAGFTLSTEVCTAFYENNRQYPEGLREQVEEALSKVETIMEARFGDPKSLHADDRDVKGRDHKDDQHICKEKTGYGYQ